MFGDTAKLNMIQLIMRGCLKGQKVIWVKESKHEMTDSYFRNSLTIKGELHKSRFLKIHKLVWRPLEKIIEWIKGLETTGRY